MGHTVMQVLRILAAAFFGCVSIPGYAQPVFRPPSVEEIVVACESGDPRQQVFCSLFFHGFVSALNMAILKAPMNPVLCPPGTKVDRGILPVIDEATLKSRFIEMAKSKKLRTSNFAASELAAMTFEEFRCPARQP